MNHFTINELGNTRIITHFPDKLRVQSSVSFDQKIIPRLPPIMVVDGNLNLHGARMFSTVVSDKIKGLSHEEKLNVIYHSQLHNIQFNDIPFGLTVRGKLYLTQSATKLDINYLFLDIGCIVHSDTRMEKILNPYFLKIQNNEMTRADAIVDCMEELYRIGLKDRANIREDVRERYTRERLQNDANS